MEVNLFIKGKNGIAIVCNDNSVISSINCPNFTDNQCEWKALCDAMSFIGLDYERVDGMIYNIFIDSKLLLSQILGKVPTNCIFPFVGCKSQRIKSKNLKSYYLLWNFLKNELSDMSINYKYSEPLDNLARLWLK